MAALVRWTFANMRDEALKRAARYGETDATARMPYFVDAAYRRIAATWYHDVLVKETTLTIADTARVTSALPADLYLPIGGVLALSGTRTHVMGYKHAADVFTDVRAEGNGAPKEMARKNTVMQLDRGADNANYTIVLLYYASPTTPDFDGAANSELDRLFDEAIVQMALALAFPASWRFDMASVNAQLFVEWVETSAHAKVRELMLPAQAEKPLSSTLLGGAKG